MYAHVYSFQIDPVKAAVQYDKEFIVCSLDLLSGLAEGLGIGIESLVLQNFILKIRGLCIYIIKYPFLLK